MRYYNTRTGRDEGIIPPIEDDEIEDSEVALETDPGVYKSSTMRRLFDLMGQSVSRIRTLIADESMTREWGPSISNVEFNSDGVALDPRDIEIVSTAYDGLGPRRKFEIYFNVNPSTGYSDNIFAVAFDLTFPTRLTITDFYASVSYVLNVFNDQGDAHVGESGGGILVASGNAPYRTVRVSTFFRSWAETPYRKFGVIRGVFHV